jgi:hypothetical protein
MKTETVFTVCDICNAPESSEIRFGVMGADYGIDLCELHMSRFKEFLSLYVSSGHKIKARPHSIRRDAPTPIDAKPKRTRKRKQTTTEEEGAA